MKKNLVLLAGLLVASGIASAAQFTIACTPSNNISFIGQPPGTTGSGQLTCPSGTAGGFVLPPGGTLGQVTLFYAADYSFGSSSPNTVSTVFQVSNPGIWNGPNVPSGPPVTCTVTGTFTSDPGLCSVPTGANPPFTGAFNTATGANAQNLISNGFTINVTSTLVAGSVSAATYGAYLRFDYSTSVPEPASMLTLGGGLLAFGFMLKRKKRA